MIILLKFMYSGHIKNEIGDMPSPDMCLRIILLADKFQIEELVIVLVLCVLCQNDVLFGWCVFVVGRAISKCVAALPSPLPFDLCIRYLELPNSIRTNKSDTVHAKF